jgi:hypothetical protein
MGQRISVIPEALGAGAAGSRHQAFVRSFQPSLTFPQVVFFYPYLPPSAAENPYLFSMGMKAAFLKGRDGLGISVFLRLGEKRDR